VNRAGAPADDVERVAMEVCRLVAAAVRPHLGRGASRVPVGVAPGGDVTMAIDEVAEDVLDAVVRDAGDLGSYSEDRGLVTHGRPRAFLVVDPVDGTRPAAAGLESCCVSVAVVPPDPAATLGDVSFGVVEEIKGGQRFWAARGRGAHAARADGSALPLVCSATTDLRRLFWTAGLRGRPAVPLTVALERLLDRSSMGGGYFDLGSATFSLTRLVTGQLDAYVDLGHRIVRELPHLEARFREVGEGAVCTNFPYDVAAAALVVQEAGGVVTLADSTPIDACPAVGSGDGYGLAVLAASNAQLHAALLEEVERGMRALSGWATS
jgi:myo-inositol-1(or 4)-monophosphatase